MGSLAFLGCNITGSDSGNPKASVNGTIDLTATNAAALGGLTFTFPDGTLFGFSGQSATLAFGTDGTTFTLTTSDGAVLNGTITYGSCTLTQNPVPPGTGAMPFTQTYDTCQVTGQSDGDIEFGGAGTGTITLKLGNVSIAPVASNPTRVVYRIDVGGSIIINDNTTRIGIVG
jgi:hypothetical protein